MSLMITAERVTDLFIQQGFKMSRVSANTPAGRMWLRTHTVVGRFNPTLPILIDSSRVDEFVFRICLVGLTVATVES